MKRCTALLLLAFAAACNGAPESQPPQPDAPAPPPKVEKAIETVPTALPHRPPAVLPRPMAKGAWEVVAPKGTTGLLTAVEAWGGKALVGTTDGAVMVVDSKGDWSELWSWPEPIMDVEVVASGGGFVAGVLTADGRIWLTRDMARKPVEVRPVPKGHSADGQRRWSPLLAPYQDLALTMVEGRLVALACGLTTHVAYTRDDGKTWQDTQIAGRQHLMACDVGPEGTLLTAGERGQAFRLDPDQSEWSHIPLGGNPHIQAVAVDPKNPDRMVFAGLQGVLRRSDNRGNAWHDHALDTEDLTDLSIVGGSWRVTAASGVVMEVDPGSGRRKVLRKADGRTLGAHAETSEGALVAVGPELAVFSSNNRGKWQTLRDVAPLRDVWAAPSGRAFAVGDRGQFLRLDDKQIVGVKTDDGSLQDMTAVTFAGGRFGWAVSRQGTIMATRDGGVTWASSKIEQGGVLSAIAALDVRNVFVGGDQGQILVSNDSGESWKGLGLPKDSTALPPALLDMAFWKRAAGPVLLGGGERGSVRIGRSGRSEVDMAMLSGLTGILGVASSEETAWLLDVSGVLLRRRAEEAVWTVLAVPSGMIFVDGAFDDAGRGVVLAASGAVLRTDDGGSSWTLAPHGFRKATHGVASAGDGVFVIVGHGGAVLRSEGRGVWVRTEGAPGRTLVSVAQVDGALVGVGVGGVAVQSQDGGKTWAAWSGAPSDLGRAHLTQIVVGLDGRVALGGFGASWVREGGAWTKLSAPEGEKLKEPGRMVFDAEGGLWVVETVGVLRHRLSGGMLRAVDWVPEGRAPVRWRSVASDGRRVVALMEGGDLAVRKGDAWSVMATPKGLAPERLMGSAGRIWLAGPGGLWGQSEASFAQVLPAWPEAPSAIHFQSPLQGLAVGVGGTIMETDDGGETWRGVASPTRGDLMSVHVGDSGTAWAVGAAGTVLRRSSGPSSAP